MPDVNLRYHGNHCLDKHNDNLFKGSVAIAKIVLQICHELAVLSSLSEELITQEKTNQ